MPEHYQIQGRTAAAIATSIETAVRDGDLQPGAAIPPVRALADQLHVAAGTVAKAYQDLRQRGVIETAGRHGTRIRPRPPVAVRTAAPTAIPAGLIDLSAGEPDPQLLPQYGNALQQVATSPVNYAHGGPLPELLDLARTRLAADGLRADADLTVTGGALDAIDRLLSAHLRPGDRVAVEDPGWANLYDLLSALGLRPIGMPIDDEGPTPGGLRKAIAAGANAVIITTRAQNPTGAALSHQRAADLRQILTAHPDLLTIEDDHAAELSADKPHLIAGATNAWAFVRSTSKPYGPDLRLAIVAGDPTTVARVAGRMRIGAGWVSTVLQRMVIALWRDPHTTALVARAGTTYTARRDALRQALAQRGITAYGRTGLNIWVPVADETHAVTVLRDRGYAVAAGSGYRLGSPPGIRITTSQLDLADVPAVAAAIAEASTPAPAGYGR